MEETTRGSRGSSPCKKIRGSSKEQEVEVVTLESSTISGPDDGVSTATDRGGKRTVTCYQCSLCPFLSQTLPLLKEHLKQHNEQHSDLILMCSECHFWSRDQGQLEAHVRLHFNPGDGQANRNPVTLDGDEDASGKQESTMEVIKSTEPGAKELPKKKWYSYEEYGLYRCLICSYVCSQQRMLKTHAWKHAGLVDCSYPIFEDEEETLARRDALAAAANATGAREEVVVLSPVLQDKQKAPFKLQLFAAPLAVESKSDEGQRATEQEDEGEVEDDAIKDLSAEEPVVEVQVKTEAESAEVDIDSHPNSSSTADSLLSSAQKIINSSPNSAGHINVIVERLPSAEDSVTATNPLLLSPNVDRYKGLLDPEEEAEEGEEKEDTPSKPSPVVLSADSPRDENVPPAGRKRTHSESLRLHSLAAEALVTMPMRTPELAASSSKVSRPSVTKPLHY